MKTMMNRFSFVISKFFLYLYKRKEKVHHLYKYNTDALLIPAGHIPYMSYRLLSGSVVVFYQNKIIAEYGPHTTWGAQEILNAQVARYSVYIKKGSLVCAIGKSELQKVWMRIFFLLEKDMLAEIKKTPGLS